jgi:REP element-mobilizing transposase RayT
MKHRSSQLDLLSKEALRYAKSWSHGGQSLKKRRKVARPLLPKKITHVVFKSSKARGTLSFLTHRQKVSRRLQERARRFHVKVHEWVNMGNHLHLKISCNDTARMKLFLGTFAGLLARDLTGACRGKKFGKFWDALAYTRVLHSAFEELGLRGYFEANHRQREMGYAERESYLKSWNAYLRRLRTVRAKSRNEAALILSLS